MIFDLKKIYPHPRPLSFREEGRERNIYGRREKHKSVASHRHPGGGWYMPRPRVEPATQACAPNGNGTCNASPMGWHPNQLGDISQGTYTLRLNTLTKWKCKIISKIESSRDWETFFSMENKMCETQTKAVKHKKGINTHTHTSISIRN